MRRTSGNGSSSWPSPKVSEANGSGEHGTGGPDLRTVSENWQTSGTDSFRSRGGDRIEEPGLDRQARFWATPSSRDEKGEYLDGAMVRNDGKARGDLPPDQASRFSHPTARETTSDGPRSSPTIPTSRPRLNVAFVAHLMGWPDFLALSGYASSETAWCHWWRLMRSAHWQGQECPAHPLRRKDRTFGEGFVAPGAI